VFRGQRLSGAGPGWLTAGAAALMALVLLLPGLGASPFDDPGEGQHAEIAREIATGGDWVTLRLNGVRYFDKPPLLYWLTAASFRVLGPHEWAARLVPLTGAILAVAATALLGARLLGASGGLIAASALLSSVLFVAFARYLRPETLFVAAIQWGFTGLLLGLRGTAPAARQTTSPWILVGCGALGVASLVKDPLGVVGPLAALGIALALARRARPLSAWLPWGGVSILLAVGFGWYVMAALRNAGFLWYTVVDNHLLNAIRLRHFPDEDVPLSALEFLAVSGLGALPWVIPAALAMASLVRRRAWRDPSETPWVVLALWAAGLFVVTAVMPFKLPHYALPAYPAIALLAARGWQDREASASGLIGAHLLFLVLAAAACAVAAASDGKAFTDLVFSATDVYTRKEAVWGEAGPVPPWPALRALMWRGALICGLTSVALALALIRRSGRLGLVVVTVGMLALMPLVGAARHLLAFQRTVAVMAQELGREMGPRDVLVHEGPIENSGALEFYSGRRPALLDSHQSVLGFGATFPDARGVFWDAARFRREWLYGGRRLLLVTPRSPALSVAASLPPERVRILLHDNGRWLYDNQARRGASPSPRSLPPGIVAPTKPALEAR
jgi:4-amino-4-deoxy-L-arabinose transferase-like glycosyltransferase